MTDTVRGALRVAILRQDPLSEFWLRHELRGVRLEKGDSGGTDDALLRLVALVGAEEAERQRLAVLEAFLARRTVETDGKKVIVSHGIAELEVHNKLGQEMHDEPVTPGMTPLDTGLASLRRDQNQAALVPMLLQQQTVMARIKEAASSSLLQAEAELLAGQSVPGVIARGRAFVETELARVSPDALEALRAAEERAAQGSPESLSHAATSCRRAIKALADSLYPAGKPVIYDNGTTRNMGDDQYRNRLIEYVRQRRGKSTHADVLASNLAILGTRLKSLDDLASKGVHNAISEAEAESCVSWTYMLAADLLRIEEQAGSS